MSTPGIDAGRDTGSLSTVGRPGNISAGPLFPVSPFIRIYGGYLGSSHSAPMCVNGESVRFGRLVLAQQIFYREQLGGEEGSTGMGAGP